METPEVSRGGDLMFTTGFPIKDDMAAQVRWSADRRLRRRRPVGSTAALPAQAATRDAQRGGPAERPLFTIAADVQFID